MDYEDINSNELASMLYHYKTLSPELSLQIYWIEKINDILSTQADTNKNINENFEKTALIVLSYANEVKRVFGFGTEYNIQKHTIKQTAKSIFHGIYTKWNKIIRDKEITNPKSSKIKFHIQNVPYYNFQESSINNQIIKKECDDCRSSCLIVNKNQPKTLKLVINKI